jgi:hypothetical protein
MNGFILSRRKNRLKVIDGLIISFSHDNSGFRLS